MIQRGSNLEKDYQSSLEIRFGDLVTRSEKDRHIISWLASLDKIHDSVEKPRTNTEVRVCRLKEHRPFKYEFPDGTADNPLAGVFDDYEAWEHAFINEVVKIDAMAPGILSRFLERFKVLVSTSETEHGSKLQMSAETGKDSLTLRNLLKIVGAGEIQNKIPVSLSHYGGTSPERGNKVRRRPSLLFKALNEAAGNMVP